VRGPVAGPVASSAAPWEVARGGGSREIGTPNHSSSPDVRISSPRLDSIASALTPLDRSVVGLVAQTRLCSGGQLERLFWCQGQRESDARQARKVLSRLTTWRLLDRLARRVGGRRAGSRGFLYTLGPAGVRLLARETGVRVRRLVTPGDRYIGHVLSCTELVVRLQEATGRGDLDLIEIQSEPECWRGFLGPFGARLVLKPDLFVRIGVGALEDRWMMEVDLATEARGTLTAKFKRYLAHYRSGAEQRDHGIYPRVLWAVPDQRRAAHVQDVMRALPPEAERLVTVCLLDEAVERLGIEASS
jgi:hypothetical protein